ncbi:hypothetical protein [Streptomyces sp. NBC_00448]|uniref:hypothetical protein n=1 Tax=Streptomyces sp. NBC_00448 TaxID=2903652 RepID=UPI002E1B9B55
MAGVGVAGRRGIARLLLACAVLAGLFLMHGAPSTAAEGCHGDVTSLAAMHADSGGPMAVRGPATAPRSGSAVDHGARAAAPVMAHGEKCVSTPARGRGPLPVNASAAVVTVAAVPVLVGRAAPVGRRWRRGPPTGGRDLLLRVGIART